MRQIESFSLGEICFCVSSLENIRILPGINLVDDIYWDKLENHPAFIIYLDKGILEEIHINQDEFKIDTDTNITVIETKDEKIPIQNLMINTQSQPIAKKGILINPSMAKKAGLSQDVAYRIVNFMPSTGWVSTDQIRKKLDLSNDVDLSKLPLPTVSTETPKS